MPATLDRDMLSRMGVLACRGSPDVIAGGRAESQVVRRASPGAGCCHGALGGPASDPLSPPPTRPRKAPASRTLEFKAQPTHLLSGWHQIKAVPPQRQLPHL